LPLFDTIIGKGNRTTRAARSAYVETVKHARSPVLYLEFGVPDSVDGRFEMIVLHVILQIHRLKGEGEAAEKYAQALIECLIDDMDRSLREMGVGDLSVGKKVKQMAAAFYGRASAYDAALSDGADDSLLSDALCRNVFGTTDAGAEQLAAICRYVRDCVTHLDQLTAMQVMGSEVSFFTPQSTAERD
jgi:cytochrome b pre-mRNA-processing protein 3